MAKVTMNDMVFEGTPEEIAVLFAEMEKRQAKDETSEDAPCCVEEPKEETFKVGDYVKIVGGKTGYHSFGHGAIVKVVGLDGWHGDSDRLLCEDTKGHQQSIERDDVVKVTKEEIAASTKPKEELLNVGDYAKVINAKYYTMSGFKNGDIVEILRSSYGDDDEDYRVKKVNDITTGYVAKVGGYVVKATEEEVAEIKAEFKTKETQRKLEAKWTKIDRKVDEFKVGDIVLVTGSDFGHKVGTIGEVVPAPEFFGTDIGVLANGIKKSHIGQMELITPVEARFDR